jgi:hypothetical protein
MFHGRIYCPKRARTLIEEHTAKSSRRITHIYEYRNCSCMVDFSTYKSWLNGIEILFDTRHSFCARGNITRSIVMAETLSFFTNEEPFWEVWTLPAPNPEDTKPIIMPTNYQITLRRILGARV